MRALSNLTKPTNTVSSFRHFHDTIESYKRGLHCKCFQYTRRLLQCPTCYYRTYVKNYLQKPDSTWLDLIRPKTGLSLSSAKMFWPRSRYLKQAELYMLLWAPLVTYLHQLHHFTLEQVVELHNIVSNPNLCPTFNAIQHSLTIFLYYCHWPTEKARNCKKGECVF